MTAVVRRRATMSDLDSITTLDAQCFDTPWPASVYTDELRNPHAVVELALTHEAAVVGLSCSWIVAEDSHLLRLCTLPRLRGAGIGAELLRAVVARARSAGCTRIDLEVGRQNTAAVRLYERAGFVAVGLRRGYYRRPPDDALQMRMFLG